MPYDRSAFTTRTPMEGVAFDFMEEQTDFIADSVFPPKVVDQAQKKVYQADTSKLKVYETRKKTNAAVDLIDEQLFSRNITLEEHKLGAEINPMDVRDGDAKALLNEARKVKIVTMALMRKREELAATIATTVANYPSDLTAAVSSGARWNEAGGDPEADRVVAAEAVRIRCGVKPNALAIDDFTLAKLTLSPSFRDRIKYTNGGPVTTEAIKAFFDVKFLFVGRALRDSAVEGAAASIAGFWGANALLFYHNPSVAVEDVSFGHMYMTGTPFWTKVVQDPMRTGNAGDMRVVQVGTEYVLDKGFVVSSSDSDFAAGYLFRTVVA